MLIWEVFELETEVGWVVRASTEAKGLVQPVYPGPSLLACDPLPWLQ